MSKRGMPEVIRESIDDGYDKILDALKDITKVYDRSEYHLDPNQIFAKQPNDKWQEFITRQKVVAMSIKNSFPNIKIIKRDEEGNIEFDENGNKTYTELENPYGRKTHDLIMSPVYAWQIMNRNTKENTLLMGVLEFNKSGGDLEGRVQENDIGEGNAIKKRIGDYFKKREDNKEQTIIGTE